MSAIVRAASFVAVGVLTVSVSVATVGATSAAENCSAHVGSAVVDLTEEQTANARVVVAIGQQRGVSSRGLVIALMAAMQESTLRNLDYGDRDSLGLFQQRPSAGWGTPEQVLGPAYAAAAFFGGPRSPAPNPGLLDLAGWEQLPLTVAAHAVQRSGFPGAYAKWEPAATSWLAALIDDSMSGRAGCLAATGAAAVAIAAAERWLGTPYAWGGGDLDGPTRGTGNGAGTVGFDCSGLTRYAWAQAGIVLPRMSRDQWNAPGLRITSMSDLQPGDLIFFASNLADPRTIFHVGIATADGAMLEAPQTGDVVKILPAISENSYWVPRFIGGLRVSGS